MPFSSRSFRYWVPVILWLTVIAIESLLLSSGVTGGWLWSVVKGLHIPISPDAFERLHHFLRKAGHVSGYGILCLLLFRASYHSLQNSPRHRSTAGFPKGLRGVCAAIALGGTLLTGTLDEWHQSFDPSRTSSVRDVGLDFIGGVIFLTVALFVFRAWRELPAPHLETSSA